MAIRTTKLKLPTAAFSDVAAVRIRSLFSVGRQRVALSVLGAQWGSFSTSPGEKKMSPFASASSPSDRKVKHKFVPRKAAVAMTPKARNYFRALLDHSSSPDIVGVLLNYHQSSSGEPRMVFSFDFCKAEHLSPMDEGISLEVLDDGVTPKPPDESQEDGLKKLYVHHNAFMKVLGCTLDVDKESFEPLLFDREGNKLDPNA